MTAPNTRQGSAAVSESPAATVEWRDFGFTYPGEDKPALNALNLRFGAGERVLVMGPSGCGKSTLGLTLNGIIPRNTGGVATGTVLVDGKLPYDEELAQMATRVGLVFQDPDSQLCTINVRDEIAFGPQNLLVPEGVIRERLRRAAGLVGMQGHLDRDVFQLSGGQKQRVAIASSLACHPGLIVLDEPTANLDPIGRREVLEILSEVLRESKMTTIVIEHHPAELIELMDRVVIMNNGCVLFSGPPREVFADHGVALAELGIRLPAATLFSLFEGSTPRGTVPLHVREIDFDRHVSAEPSRAEPEVPEGSIESIENVRIDHEAPPLIEFDGVSFGYGNRKRRRNVRSVPLVLDQVSFAVHSGEIVAILGSNGSGKSTSSALMVGISRPTQGAVRIAGLSTVKRSVADIAHDVGFVFQYPEHQFVSDTVLGEVLFSLRRLAHSPKDMETLARHELERFDLAHLAEKNPFKLSLGQKRRLSIAAMTVYRPRVLLLDEPTFGQDAAHTADLISILRDLHSSGTAIVLVTHDLRLTAEIATRTLVLDQGHIAHDGAPRGLLERLHRDGGFAGLWPVDEYAVWHEVSRRRPGIPFTTDMRALGRLVAKTRRTPSC